MKLKNKKTGMIGVVGYISPSDGSILVYNIKDEEEWYRYNSLAEINKEWKDYEESKEYYAIDLQGDIIRWARHSWDEKTTNKIKEIGNYFETEEEAKEAVKKLEAWKRLKDKGFKFSGWEIDQKKHLGIITIKTKPYYSFEFEDLDLLFSGGEE